MRTRVGTKAATPEVRTAEGEARSRLCWELRGAGQGGSRQVRPLAQRRFIPRSDRLSQEPVTQFY